MTPSWVAVTVVLVGAARRQLLCSDSEAKTTVLAQYLFERQNVVKLLNMTDSLD